MQADLVAEFSKRKAKVDAEAEAERKAKEEKKAKGGVIFEGAKFRGEIVDDVDPAFVEELGKGPRLVRKMGKHDKPSFPLWNRPQDFMLFLSEFSKRQGVLEIGDLAFNVSGACRLSEGEMAASLQFQVAESD
jgi:hypothetical protein